MQVNEEHALDVGALVEVRSYDKQHVGGWLKARILQVQQLPPIPSLACSRLTRSCAKIVYAALCSGTPYHASVTWCFAGVSG